MTIVVNLRLGIGLDIEFNEDILHLVDVGDKENILLAYSGILINLPFLKIYIGEFDEMELEDCNE
jgi:hypothetical protein